MQLTNEIVEQVGEGRPAEALLGLGSIRRVLVDNKLDWIHLDLCSSTLIRYNLIWLNSVLNITQQMYTV